MNYISTRGNHPPVASAQAINLGMVPSGGLFLPELIPVIDNIGKPGPTYQETAQKCLSPFLGDFSAAELDTCVRNAYTRESFDTHTVIDLKVLDKKLSVLELWHGPTAAFKDMALQIMPHFLSFAKRKTGAQAHTVILVATSGDTGKAALEGFKDCEGISIIVFYPHGGVSELQRLQMATTGGSNTHVVAVKGNFDDCQTAVKNIFGDPQIARTLNRNGFVFSSANSINWGRLCPQIVYYVRAYAMLVEGRAIREGDPVNFCVPTGNFGNILAGFYARMMGLPVAKLICASNRNNVLADFFASGTYDRNREFFRTMSPSMDILISSNLERFLFEMSRHDSAKLAGWYDALAQTGRFEIGPEIKTAIDKFIVGGWVDEKQVLSTIGRVYAKYGYVLDTHTAVAAAVAEQVDKSDIPTVIVSTASPFKFSSDVLAGLNGERIDDEFKALDRLAQVSAMPIHRALADLRDKPVCHDAVVEVAAMKKAVLDIVAGIAGNGVWQEVNS